MFSNALQNRSLLAGLILLVLLALACDISVDPGFDIGGSSNENLQATEIALLQTQIALEQAQQQASADNPPQPEQPAQPEEQPPADNPAPDTPAQPEQTQTPEGPTPNAVFGDISFYLDPAVAASASHSSVPATGQDDPWGLPAHEMITFSGYTASPSFHDPRIIIIPIADYIARDEYVKQPRDRLQQLLATRPQDPGDSLPFLPFWNAGPLFDAQFDYVDFQNGGGIRYLTQHGQATWPINNTDMFYTYQGLTNDGLYYVSAILPAKHPSLPADGDSAQITDWNAFSENFVSYAEDIERQLNSEPDSMFTPSLELLDELFASLKVK
jgi:hypothetical protein